MNKDKKIDDLNILREIHANPSFSQRKLSKRNGLSLGKLNYCLKALKAKGLIKFNNFKKNKNKQKYFYVLTPKGVTHKTKLAINFMKLKMKEYEELKKEVEENRN